MDQHDVDGAGDDRSSLEAKETYSQTLLRPTRWQARTHGRLVGCWSAIVRALRSDPRLGPQRRGDRVAECARAPLIALTWGGDVRLVTPMCRDRVCPRCCLCRSAAAEKRTESLAKGMDSPRHLVLTAPACDASLSDQVRILQAAFRRMRRSAAWIRHVRGGVATIEVTISSRTDRWHPHLHVLLDGVYWNQPDIVHLWRESLRAENWPSGLSEHDSVIVHISAVHSRREAARYVSKYIAKPTEMSSWNAAKIVEYAISMVGVRSLSTFGSCHGVPLDGKPERAQLAGCVVWDSVCRLRSLAEDGLKMAERAMTLITALFPAVYRAWCDDEDCPAEIEPDKRADCVHELREIIPILAGTFVYG